ncbi:symmetrical bis(5'-nucleosyl)-tetraphosphatase [Cupriavidus metallidurans]|jgi:bis(5'-nucleosyl)-tetraphosphatase (symmetrical)|uniref:symmetrical bis(5'-nucleosyl)-tetraphosphatase n=1 Tax=Cupriavidus metallidurans TaxID=119219 RepID=UPI000CE0635A|nr:symmetrical bis(5'-nucleosyl)-tetraphosphatase [Cupriavidus metallidurans]AVA36773.1 bis(5'-nucleosyl)-tetraphosphatase (symmetrical) [Cupriavidus metallidurans]UBM10295.1 symmetrical bis(5'-nucleosyl)-tetraphosphatase [Cupriavidus metallidurans]
MQHPIAGDYHPCSTPVAIGDLQGCAPSFFELLERLPHDAPLRLVGDLVNRGPASLETLRTIIAMGSRVRTVLGNHDIHLLAVAAGVRKKGKSDTFDDILRAPDSEALLTWLRHQPLAIREDDFLIVHAGILPQWDTDQVIALAQEVETELQGPNWQEFLSGVFGNSAVRWHDDLIGIERQRVIVNALTRLRYCSADGVMDLKTKEGLDSAPAGVMPWFDVPGRRTADVTVVCGHWSTLGLVMRPNLIALDTGCVWGGRLTAAKLAARPELRTIVQVDCPQYQDPLA